MIGLVKTSAPSFKKWPDRLSKPAALNMLVIFKIVKMVFSETVARFKNHFEQYLCTAERQYSK